MKKPPDISLPVLRKTDITRLRIASHGPGKFRELTIEVAALRCSGSPDEYQLRCRHCSSRGNEKHWIQVVDKNDFQGALESLSHSRVPVIPVETVVGDGPETELTLWWGANQVAYTWWCLPPSGYECLANFVDRLVVWAGAAEYLGWDKGLEDRLNEPALVDLAGRKIYARGLQYSEAGHVTELCKTESELRATVHVTDEYSVRLWVEDGELNYQCSCPMGATGLCCKHVVAVGLEWLG